MKEIGAGILAGGRSSRLGQDKAFLQWDGQSLLERTIRACRGFEQVLVSVDRKERFAHLAEQMVEDELQNFGPVEGIYQLLRACQTPHLLIVATDMPYLQPEFLHRLANTLEPWMQALVLRVKGQLEPLCSIYSKEALPYLHQMRQAGVHQIRPLYEKVQTAYVDLETLGAPENLVENINTQADYQALLQGKS